MIQWKQTSTVLAAALLVALGCDTGPPAAWPVRFGGTSHTSVGKSGPTEEPKLVWTYPFTWRDPQPPVGDSERIYLAAERTVVAIDAETGKELWEAPRKFEVTGGPAVVGSKVLVTVGDFIDCLDSATGEQIWRTHIPWLSYSDPTVSGRMVLAECRNPSKTRMSRLVALDLKDGDEVWEARYMNSKHVTPAVYRNSAVVTSGAGVVRIALKDGSEIWKHEFDRSEEVGNPVVGEGNVYFWKGMGGTIVCLSLETGEEVWSARPPGDPWDPALAGGRLLFESLGEGFIALDAATGEQLWHVPRDGNLESTPVVAGELAYWPNGRALVATQLSDGKIVWEIEMPHSARGAALHQGRVLVNSRKHGLLCYR